MSQYMSYHGSTYGSSNLNGNPDRGTVEPGIAGFVKYWGPNWREHGIKFETEEEESAFYLRMLEKQIIQEGTDKIAALFIEPILGAGGAKPMTKGFLEGVRELTKKYGILLVCDEVMAGFGRTGKWFTFQHYGIEPDMVTFSKGSTCGYIPLGCCVVSKEIADYYEDKWLPAGLTYAAHPMGCAAALATIQVYQDEGIIEHAAEMGKFLLPGFKKLEEKHPSLSGVRGLGLLTCADVVGKAGTKEGYNIINQEFLKRGCTPYMLPGRILLCPPCIVTKEQIDWLLQVTDEVFTVADTLL